MFIAGTGNGSIHTASDLIRKFGGRVVSILTSYEKAPQGYRNVYIRAYQINRQNISQLLKELKEKATLLHMVDHRDGTRELQ